MLTHISVCEVVLTYVKCSIRENDCKIEFNSTQKLSTRRLVNKNSNNDDILWENYKILWRYIKYMVYSPLTCNKPYSLLIWTAISLKMQPHRAKRIHVFKFFLLNESMFLIHGMVTLLQNIVRTYGGQVSTCWAEITKRFL